ncbi:MAG: TorF family putative porin [Steroidobacteraceae bacterium]
MTHARIYLSGIALMATAAAAQADGLTVTPAVVSDYDFRGVSQSATDPALQAGVDYTAGAFHVGAWASTIDFGRGSDADAELDLAADYSFAASGISYNTGIVYYTYPGEGSLNTPEIWISGNKGWFTGALHYSWDWFNAGNEYYVEGNGNFPIGKSGYAITGHIGYNFGEAYKPNEYTDYSVGVTKSFGNFNASLKYVFSDAPENRADVFNTEDRLILGVSTTLPWAK